MIGKETKKRPATAKQDTVPGLGVPTKVIKDLCQVLKLLSDETRLRILFYLAFEHELHVTDLCNRLGQSQPAVSHHLALLRVANLIEARREGKHNYYSVRSEHFRQIMEGMLNGDKKRQFRFDEFVLSYDA